MNFRDVVSFVVCFFLFGAVCLSQSQYFNNVSGFTENKGQWHKDALFRTKTNDGDVWITQNGVAFTFFAKPQVVSDPNKIDVLKKNLGYAVFMEFNGVSYGTQTILKGKQLQGIENYIIGKDSRKWVHNVRKYEDVVVGSLYPGISAKYYKSDNSFRYDFILEPYANPELIQFSLKGVKRWSIDNKTNSLIFETKFGEYRHAGLKAYQLHEGKQIVVPCSFVKKGNSIGFNVQRKIPDAQLIIDPIVYSTYLGGSSAMQDVINDVALDVNFKQKEDAYFVGTTSSADFPVSSGTVTVKAQDAFVVKFNKTNGIPVYTTFIGGDGDEEGLGIAIDKNDRAWVCGSTMSSNFPVRGANGGSLQGTKDGFIVRLNNGGSAIEMGRFVGGTSTEALTAIEVTPDNSNIFAFVIGNSGTGFPTSTSAFKKTNPKVVPPLGGPLVEMQDAIVGKYTEQGLQIWATYIGAADHSDSGNDIELDPSGYPIIAVETPATGYPTTSGAIGSTDPDVNSYDIAITKFNAEGSALVWSAVIGGSGSDGNPKIDVDGGGNVYCTATTGSANFPTQFPFQSSLNGGTDVVLFKLNNGGSSFAYSSYCGGNDNDFSGDIAIDQTLRPHISFSTNGDLGSYVNSNTAFQSSLRAGFDGAIMRFSSTGQPSYGTYFGGSGNDFFKTVAVDVRGNVYVGGYSISNDFPIENYADNTMSNGDAVAIKFCIGPEPCSIQYNAGADFTICEGDVIQIGSIATNLKETASYEWYPLSVADAGSFNDKEAKPFVSPKASTTFYCIAYDGICCPVLDSVRVTVLPLPKVNAGNDTTICQGSSVKIGNPVNGAGNYVYSWSPAAGLSDPNIPQPVATPSVNTKYVVTVTDIANSEKQCIAKDEIWVYVNQRPVAQAGNDQKICAGSGIKIGSVAVSGTPPYNYSWTPANNLDNANIPTPTATPPVTTDYIVTVMDSKGCIDIDTVKVEVFPQILSTLPSTVTICADQEYVLKPGITGGREPFTVRWEPPTDLSDRFAFEPKLKKSQPGSYSYTINIEDANKCTISKKIDVIVRASVTLVTKQDKLDFGALSSCISSKLDSMEITNNETEPVSFVEVGNVSPGFSFAGSLPIVIPAGGKAFVKVRFVPGSEGTTNGSIQLKTDVCNLLYSISLTGSKDGLLTKAEPTSVVFLNRYNCDVAKDTTIIVRNTSDKDITFSFDKTTVNNPFQLASPLVQKVIKPNSVEQVTIRILSANAGTYNSVLTIPFASPDCEDTLKIPLSTDVLNPRIQTSVTEINIGNLIGCEQSKDTSITISNTSGTRLRVTGIEGTNISVQSADLPLVLESGEQKIIRLSISPSGDGTFNENINLISEPCNVKTGLVIRGNKAGVLFVVNDTLDLGIIPTCLPINKVGSFFEITNKSGGNASGTIKSIRLSSNDFVCTTPSGTVLPNNVPVKVDIKYNNTTLEEKTYIAKAILTLSPCDIVDSIVVKLKSEEPKLTYKDNGVVNFENVSTSPQSKSLVIENKNSFPWYVKSVVPKSSQITVKPAGNNSFPLTVPAKGSASIDVVLQANSTITTDTLSVNIETDGGNCTSIDKAFVNVGSIDSKVSINLESRSVKPGEYFDYTISLKDIPDNLVGKTYRFTGSLVFNKNLLTDRAQKCIVNGKDCTLPLNSNVTLSKNTIVTVPMLALLGDSNSSPIELSNPQLIDANIIFQVNNATVTIENTCTDEQRYFISTPPTQIQSITPNPAHSTIKMKFSVSEGGKVIVSVLDLFGNRIKTLIDQDLQVGTYETDVPIDLSSGTYSVLLETLTRQHTTRITVVE